MFISKIWDSNSRGIFWKYCVNILQHSSYLKNIPNLIGMPENIVRISYCDLITIHKAFWRIIKIFQVKTFRQYLKIFKIKKK